MIHLVTASFSPRLEYVAQILFEQLLGVDFQLVNWEEATILPASAITLNYTEYPIEGALAIPNCGLLAEDDIREAEPSIDWQDNFPLLFPMSNEGPVKFDLLAAAFYLASGYTYYQVCQKDEHERYKEANLFTFKQGLYHHPWVHHYAFYLADCLKAFSSEIFVNYPQPDFEATWDIDNPWAFQNKSAYRQFLGSLKDGLTLNGQQLKKRFRVLTGQEADPFATYDFIKSHSPTEKTTMFFLVNGNSPYDGYFDLNHEAYRHLIQSFSEAGYPIGIHPSYATFKDYSLISQEKSMLEECLGQSVTHSRQHFLKFDFPTTFEYLVAAGINHDYSLCPIQEGGFLTGMAMPYHWFNLRTNEATSLQLHPTMVMDRTLQRYKGFSPETAYQYLNDLAYRTFQARGKFLILLHNETVSEFREWKGWQSVFREFFNQVEKDNSIR